jgi:hypothetical protein
MLRSGADPRHETSRMVNVQWTGTYLNENRPLSDSYRVGICAAPNVTGSASAIVASFRSIDTISIGARTGLLFLSRLASHEIRQIPSTVGLFRGGDLSGDRDTLDDGSLLKQLAQAVAELTSLMATVRPSRDKRMSPSCRPRNSDPSSVRFPAARSDIDSPAGRSARGSRSSPIRSRAR